MGVVRNINNKIYQVKHSKRHIGCEDRSLSGEKTFEKAMFTTAHEGLAFGLKKPVIIIVYLKEAM